MYIHSKNNRSRAILCTCEYTYVLYKLFFYYFLLIVSFVQLQESVHPYTRNFKPLSSPATSTLHMPEGLLLASHLNNVTGEFQLYLGVVFYYGTANYTRTARDLLYRNSMLQSILENSFFLLYIEALHQHSYIFFMLALYKICTTCIVTN